MRRATGLDDPRLADWVCHRRSKIEETSGAHESLTHALMMSVMGIPTLMALLFEIDSAVLVSLAAGCAVHEAIVIWDVAYAARRRRISTTEQHVHSFLEVLPFMSVAFVTCLHWDQATALVGVGSVAPDFSIRPKRRPIPRLYLAGIGALVTATIAIPYAEELVRCLRVHPTFAPRSAPEHSPDRESN